jgi:hypothetical protein
MPIDSNVEKVTFKEAKELISAALEANQAVMLIGDPGVGKSALAAEVAKEVDLPLETLIGSTLDATDVGGLPTVSDTHGVRRYPLPAIKAGCTSARLLFLDELATSGSAVQAAMLRLTLERVAGDDKLHPDTRVILATNPEEQSPGGMPLSAPLIGRVVFVHLLPTSEEVTNHFETFGNANGSAFEKAFASEAADFVACAKAAPDLLEISVPDKASGGNIPWGSPRAWERALRLRAQIEVRGSSARAKRAATAGSVGRGQAAAYSAFLDVRGSLPAVDVIAADPQNAMVPGDDPSKRNLRIAAVSLLPRVAERNSWAAWIWAARLDPEMRAVAARILLTKPESLRTAKFAKEGSLARIKLLAMIGGAVAKANE